MEFALKSRQRKGQCSQARHKYFLGSHRNAIIFILVIYLLSIKIFLKNRKKREEFPSKLSLKALSKHLQT